VIKFGWITLVVVAAKLVVQVAVVVARAALGQ
jgi:hypothetical protein